MPSAKTKALLGGAALAVGATGWRALGDATQVRKNQINLNANRRNDLSTPMYDPSAVKQAYETFVQTKLSAEESKGLLSSIQGAATKSVGEGVSHALGNVFVRPVDWAAKKIEKSFVTHPEQQKALQHAMKDPIISGFHRDNPQGFKDMHSALTQFAPQVSTNPLAVRTFLTQGAATGGNLDFATLNLILNAEKAHTGKGSNKDH